MSSSQIMPHPDRAEQLNRGVHGDSVRVRGRRDRRRPDKRIVRPDQSILLTEWSNPDRPYSQRELQTLKQQFFKQNQLSQDLFVHHNECGHVYHVKDGGNKWRQLSQHPEDNDLGNCSVCWKLSKTPRELLEAADDFENIFRTNFNNPRETYLNLQVLKIFYGWLYNEEYN